MYGYLVQDWTTVRVNSGLTTIVQSEVDWMSFQPYQDIVFFLEVKSANLAGSDGIVLSYQTAPVKESSLFTDMVQGVALAASDTPVVTQVLLSQNPTCPLARWVRWALNVSGAPTDDWGATFRIHCAANAVGPL